MFSRSKRGKEPIKPASKSPTTPSIIGADLRIIGDVVTDGDVQIEGLVEGDVTSGSVTVGENALIQGSIRAHNARIRGRVEGEIYARSVTLARSAKVQGDILHERISIEAGAYLDGRCRRVESGDQQLQIGGPDDIMALAAPSSADASGTSESAEAAVSDVGDSLPGQRKTA